MVFSPFRPLSRHQLTFPSFCESSLILLRYLRPAVLVSLDSTLFLEQYINKSGFYHLRNISKIRRYLSRRSAETLVHAFVTSKLNFFNSVLYRLPGYPIERLQKVQYAAARIVTLMPTRSVSRLYYTVYTGYQLNIG